MKEFLLPGAFHLETGGSLSRLRICYHTYGKLNEDGSNVVWVCHALTANSDAAGWWPGIIGSGNVIDPEKYFIVCANIIGSCYGTTGPLDIDPITGRQYLRNFPFITVRDLVTAHIALRKYLGIEKIFLMMGGSLGGYQALEWCVMEPDVVSKVFLLTTSAAESAWGMAVHEAQRLALGADKSFADNDPNGGHAGVKAARAIGMLTYRNYDIMVEKQTDPDTSKTDGFAALSYIRHQGEKLAARFNAYSYWTISKTMDSHNLSRNRGGNIDAVLKTIVQPTLILGISSDLLCPPKEQKHIARCLPNSQYAEIGSAYGHDGFLIESARIGNLLKQFLEEGA